MHHCREICPEYCVRHHEKCTLSLVSLYSWCFRNPTPAGMYKTLVLMGWTTGYLLTGAGSPPSTVVWCTCLNFGLFSKNWIVYSIHFTHESCQPSKHSMFILALMMHHAKRVSHVSQACLSQTWHDIPSEEPLKISQLHMQTTHFWWQNPAM